MNTMTRTGLMTVGLAAGLGILGDAWLGTTPWGLNLLLWTAALVSASGMIRRKQAWTWTVMERGLLAGAVVFAAVFVWRDSPTLKTLDLFAALIALSLIALQEKAVSIVLSGVWDYGLGLGRLVSAALLGGFRLLGADIAWETVPRSAWSRGANGPIN